MMAQVVVKFKLGKLAAESPVRRVVDGEPGFCRSGLPDTTVKENHWVAETRDMSGRYFIVQRRAPHVLH
jgi:hypothetical protein